MFCATESASAETKTKERLSGDITGEYNNFKILGLEIE